MVCRALGCQGVQIVKHLLMFFAKRSMSRLRYIAGIAASASAILTAMQSTAFFEWRFSEFFSNSDGSVQFIELESQGADEGQASGAQIHSLSTGMTLTLTQNLSGSTLNKKLLLATAGFGSLPNSVPPDFPATPLPANFFDPSGDTVSLLHHGTIDSRTFPYVPTDGIKSRHYPSDIKATNSPTNFGGFTGAVDLGSNFGDYNNDGTVDAADYAAYRKFLNSPLDTTNIILNDETPSWVMVDDYTVWRRRFGTVSAGGASSAAAPEPSCFVLTALAGTLYFLRRKRAKTIPTYAPPNSKAHAERSADGE
jgi:hypothetical protein